MAQSSVSNYKPIEVRTAGIASAAVSKGAPVVKDTTAGYCKMAVADGAFPILGIAYNDYDKGDIVAVVAIGEAMTIAKADVALGDPVSASGTGGTGYGVIASTGDIIGYVKNADPASGDTIIIDVVRE